MILSSNVRRSRGLRPTRRRVNRRRRHRTSVLEVSATSRTIRRRRLMLLLKLGFGCLGAAAVIWGIWAGGRRALDALFLKNEEYVIRRIEVVTNGNLTPDQVIEQSGLVEGTGIFAVSLAGTRERLERLPEVRRAEVRRLLPDRIAIRVSEREPVAWVMPEADRDPADSPEACLIDATGFLIRPLSRLPAHAHLPVIGGVRTDALRAGEPVATRDIRAALELLRVTRENLMQARWEIRAIDLSRGYCMVVTDSRGARVTLPTSAVPQQVRRLSVLLGWCQDNGRDLLTANLLPARNVPVTFVPLPGAEEPPPAASKPAAEPPVRRAVPVRPSSAPRNRGAARG